MTSGFAAQDFGKSPLMRRRLLGIIAAALVLGGIAGLVFGGGSSSQLGLFASACVRAGCVLGALWLAFPQITGLSTRFPPWLLGALLLGGLAIVIRPRSMALVAPLLMVLLAMQWLGNLFGTSPAAPRRSKRSAERGKNHSS